MGASLEWSARTRRQDQRVPLRGAACLVEPDDARRDELAGMLCGLGFLTHETASGKVAGFIAEQVSLRAAIINVLIDDVPGLQLIRYMRQRAPAAMIVAVSERVRTSMPVMLARHAGADAALVAPVSAAALAAALESAEPLDYGCPSPLETFVHSITV